MLVYFALSGLDFILRIYHRKNLQLIGFQYFARLISNIYHLISNLVVCFYTEN